jgi:type I restriction enzyme R subunit
MPTNTREAGLEDLIVDYLVQHNGYEQGVNKDFNRDYAVDESRLFRFLAETQPEEFLKIDVTDEIRRIKFLDYLQREISKRGIIDVYAKALNSTLSILLCFMLLQPKRITMQKYYSTKTYSVLHANLCIQTIPSGGH